MHPVVTEEQDLLDAVSRRLAENPHLSGPSDAELVSELVRLRDDVRCAKAEDKPSILEQYERLHALLQQQRSNRDKPEVDPASPYFAHMRLREGKVERDLCLGKATRTDGGLRIIDWRNAPIARLFYTYEQGEVYEEEIGDRVLEGEVIARRVVTIQGGELHRVQAPEGTFLRDASGDWSDVPQANPRLAGGEGSATPTAHAPGAAQGSLGTGRAHRRDKRLPDIAGLIDPEQFGLITRPPSGFLVIRGTAGSGKTTVALHRIAWLAYEDPGIDSGATLFIVFSRALRDYVANVLPELGVRHVKPVTFPDWAASLRRQHFPGLPKRQRDLTPELVTRLKAHPATMVALERQRRRVDAPATMDQAIDDWASVITDPRLLGAVLSDLDPRAFTPAQIEQATTWCRDRHAELLAWIDNDPEADGALDAEDDALLLRAWQLRVGPLRHKRGTLRYRHLAIDEVQDFSPVEVRVLLDCLDSRRSITLAGDTQQHVMQDAGFTSWADFFRWLGVEGVAVDTLRIAYRSSHEIVSLAQDLLGPISEDDTPPRTVRSGPPVELFRFTEHGAAVAFLADALHQLARHEPLASIALVAPDASTASVYHDGLLRADLPRLRRVSDARFSFQPGIDVVELQDVKGLEFDYVVVLEPSAQHYPDTPSARRLLHVAATRAIHQLWFVCVGTPSAVLRPCFADAGR